MKQVVSHVTGSDPVTRFRDFETISAPETAFSGATPSRGLAGERQRVEQENRRPQESLTFGASKVTARMGVLLLVYFLLTTALLLY